MNNKTYPGEVNTEQQTIGDEPKPFSPLNPDDDPFRVRVKARLEKIGSLNEKNRSKPNGTKYIDEETGRFAKGNPGRPKGSRNLGQEVRQVVLETVFRLDRGEKG